MRRMGVGEVHGGWDWWGGCWWRGAIALPRDRRGRADYGTRVDPGQTFGCRGTDHAVT
jgi:hypothetical protein